MTGHGPDLADDTVWANVLRIQLTTTREAEEPGGEPDVLPSLEGWSRVTVAVSLWFLLVGPNIE